MTRHLDHLLKCIRTLLLWLGVKKKETRERGNDLNSIGLCISCKQSLSVSSVESPVGAIKPTTVTSSISTTTAMPWTKRQLSMTDTAEVSTDEFQCRRDVRKFSSLRSPSKKRETPPTPSPPCSDIYTCSNGQSQQCLITGSTNENIRIARDVATPRFQRNNSLDAAVRRKTTNCSNQERTATDEIIKANLNAKSTLRNSKKGGGGNAPNFFYRYQDVLREERITDTPTESSFYDTVDTSKFTQINEVFEYLLNLHCSKPVTKTCKQLFYIRSRLSKNARKNDSMCDGCFGCGREGSHYHPSR